MSTNNYGMIETWKYRSNNLEKKMEVLANKVAVITGAASGIGAALAIALDEE
ncbi:MAG: hypothetical protein IIB71_08665, partial [Proteobacteria bacterium]|nr:hypothetical protein [Pseudomonadota bacterium]